MSSQKVPVIQRVGFINHSLLNALKLWCKMKLKHPFVHEVQRLTQAVHMTSVLLYIFFCMCCPSQTNTATCKPVRYNIFTFSPFKN